ncbi:MAG: hypothetical protein ABMA00_06765 [Gemmatimonas sp.]
MDVVRPFIRWSGAVVMMLLAGVAVDAVRAAPSRTIASAMSPYIGLPDASQTLNRPLPAAVLLQAVDCTSNLRMLHLLHRPSVRNGVRLSVLWFVGPSSDSLVIRSLLPAWTAAVPLRVAPRSLLRELARLGHTSTPTLVVLDHAGRVRFASQSPRSSREFAGLRRIVEGLTWIEEL